MKPKTSAYSNLRLLAIMLALTTAPAAFAQAAHRCADLTGFHSPGLPLEVNKAEPVAARPPAPAYCRVDGVIEPRIGADGTSYGIGFAHGLPDAWNGGFLFQGGGGLNGMVAPPMGGVAAGDTPGLARGFAVVTTDTGHKGTAFDGSFMRDQQASLDFYYVAIGRVAVLAKEMIAWYYGRAAAHSYYAGCSTGGREGMIMSQRHPSYFDGIVSGDPAIRTGYSNLALGYIGAVFSRAAPKDSSDRSDPGKLFSDSDRKLIVKSLLDRCDAKDGIQDGMIFNSRACDFDPTALTCQGAKTDQCLAASQVEALKTAFAGPKTMHGDQVYPGVVYDAGLDESTGLPGLLRGPRIPVQTGADTSNFDVDREANRVASDTNGLAGDSTWTNLSSFAGHGGKLILYHGLSDPWFSPLDTLGYYQKMARDTGGPNPVTSWSRLYLVPGMGHCGGGSAALDRFDMLTAIVNWVEKGEAPDSVIATGRAFPGRSRPLCPYPQYAEYKGSGDPNDSKNFVCKE